MCPRVESRLDWWPERTSSGCVCPLSSSSSSLLPLPLPPAPVWLQAVAPALPALLSPIHPSTLELPTWCGGKPLEWWLLAAACVGVKCVRPLKGWKWKGERKKDRSSADWFSLHCALLYLFGCFLWHKCCAQVCNAFCPHQSHCIPEETHTKSNHHCDTLTLNWGYATENNALSK